MFKCDELIKNTNDAVETTIMHAPERAIATTHTHSTFGKLHVYVLNFVLLLQ